MRGKTLRLVDNNNAVHVSTVTGRAKKPGGAGIRLFDLGSLRRESLSDYRPGEHLPPSAHRFFFAALSTARVMLDGKL